MPNVRALTRSQSLSRNFVGNVMGRLWLGGLSVATVPVFVHLLGTEAFGVVALVATLQSVVALLDFGLAGTVNREVATLRRPESEAQIPDVVRTFEFIYWTVALGIGFGTLGLSSWIATSWLTKQSLAPSELRGAIILGGVALAARWPVALYAGVLQGFERQLLQNGILIAAATTRVVLALIGLLVVSQTVYCYLAMQAVANVLEVALAAVVARRLANATGGGRFNILVIQRVWRFALGFNLVGTFGSLVSGIDKLLISNLLPLIQLTYYSVAGTATGALLVPSIAAQVTLFPRFARLQQQRDETQLRRLYLLGLGCTVYICAAPAVLLIFFPSEIVGLWARSPELAQNVQLALPMLAIATLMNSAVGTPLTALLASGDTRTPLRVNAISVPIMIVTCYVAISEYGIAGAAATWLAWNCVSFAIYAQHCLKGLLGAEARPILWGLPAAVLLSTGATGYASRVLMPTHLGPMLTLIWLAMTALASYGVGLATLNRDQRGTILAPLKSLACNLQKPACSI